MPKRHFFHCAILFLVICYQQALAQDLEPPNFSILGQLGAGEVTGFLGNGNPAPSGGLWLGIGLSDRFDGLFGMDYYTMPSQEIPVILNPTKSNPATLMNVLPTDDFALTVNVRWYLGPKYDRLHQHFNTVPYLLLGGGMDLVVDQDPAPLNANFYSKSFDVLFGMNLGGGIDFPMDDGKQWFLYAEGMDHLIAWEGLTQIYSGRIGVKFMLDSAHVDPFRGVF
ncbi:MAG TPA: hypothetical protein VJ873_13880 [bacterium]|nr:hypothetical protein [bacterium]